MAKRLTDEIDPAMKVLAGIFIVGALLYSCDHMPTGGPTEHKCWQEPGYEKC